MNESDRQALDLFRVYRRTVPKGLIPNGPTVQGVYCMTADGDYLSGYFAWASRDRAKQVIQQGWKNYLRKAKANEWNVKPIRKTQLTYSLGKPVEPGGAKLQTAVRDLPRAELERPGKNRFQTDAYNLSWIDLTSTDVASLITTSESPKPVNDDVLLKLAKSLKDSVRGQCGDWDEKCSRSGKLTTQCIAKTDSELRLRLTGHGKFSGKGRSYACQLHGAVVVDRNTNQMRDFSLVASGQRRGKDQANDRHNDLGPAPMGVAFRLFKESN